MASKDAPPPYTPSMMPGIHQQVPPSYPPAPTPTQGGYPYPQQQWHHPSYGTTTLPPSYGTTVLPPSATTVVLPQSLPEVIIVGGCPACRIGVLEDNYGLAALCCAILFFPAGILCCLLMKERKCSQCGAIFD